MSLALAKKQGYRQGTFVLEDEGSKLYQFLIQHREVYPRDSSHFVGRSPAKHRGIDVFNEPLPSMKRTLLFSQINKNLDGQIRLYLKPENFSANPYRIYDFFMHTWEFAQAQYNKQVHPGSDDLEDMRKERVPDAVMKEFNEILNSMQKYKDDCARLMTEQYPSLAQLSPKDQAKLYGIAFMKCYVDVMGKLDSIAAAFDATRFYATIQSYDHLDQRTGREVYLTQKELNS